MDISNDRRNRDDKRKKENPRNSKTEEPGIQPKIQ